MNGVWPIGRGRAACGSALLTLVLASADDMLVPFTASQRLAEGIPGSRLATMNWGGHACNVTDPDTFNRIVLDFLRS